MSHASLFGHPHNDGHDLPEFRDREVKVSNRGTRVTITRTMRCSVCGVFVDMGTDLGVYEPPIDVRAWRDLISDALGPTMGQALTDAITDYHQDHANLRWHYVSEPTARGADPKCGRYPVINKTSNPLLVDCGNCRRTRAFKKRLAIFEEDNAPS